MRNAEINPRVGLMMFGKKVGNRNYSDVSYVYVY